MTIDSQQHKVTVTGSVDVETLIKKLSRSGKYVELWPENKEKMPGKHKNNEKQKHIEESASDDHDPKNNSTEKPELAAVKNGDSGGSSKGPAGEDQPPAGDHMTGESEEPNGTADSGGGNGSGKKEKKKGQKGNPGPKGDAPDDTLSGMTPMNLSLPNQPMHPYPPIYHEPPLYEVSYNTTYPSLSYSYYAPTMHFNAYGPPPPPSDPIDKFNEDEDYDIDDESGCSIM
ncbi:hypothetical protein DITRI_Ditri13aG0079200 [Diplodiscus trichospermus]